MLGGGGSEHGSKGRSLVGQGDRKLLSFGWFGNKYEDAADLFERGANHFKLAKMWKEAAEAYTKLAEVSLKLESKHDSAAAWVEAAKAYQKGEEQKSAFFCKMGLSWKALYGYVLEWMVMQVWICVHGLVGDICGEVTISSEFT